MGIRDECAYSIVIILRVRNGSAAGAILMAESPHVRARATRRLPYGVVSAERHVYQPAQGGTTFCPMDVGARIIRKATPRFAKIVSHKFAHGAATQVIDDLEQNHGRPCLKKRQPVENFLGLGPDAAIMA